MLFSIHHDGQYDLWRTDGVRTSTVPLLTVQAIAAPQALGTVNGKIIFTTVNADSGRQMWQTDGISASLLKTFGKTATGDPAPVSFLTRVTRDGQGVMYLKADDGVTGSEMWQTDGTSAEFAHLSNDSGIDLVRQDIDDDLQRRVVRVSPALYFSGNEA